MKKPVVVPQPLGNRWPELLRHEVLAIKSLGAGTANDQQQRQALKTILEKLCGYYELTFHEHGERMSAFGEGRRFVGAVLQETLQSPFTPAPENKT